MRTLVFGGSFNPIHNGHLRLAVEALEQHGFEEVWLLPSGTPPHRAKHSTRPEHRLRMVELACLSHPRLQASDHEVFSEQASYTVDTMAQLAATHPARSFSFLTGMDALYEYRWKELGRLLGAMEVFLVASRPEYSFTELLRKLDSTPHLDRVQHLEVPLQQVSSSLIRERLAGDRSIAYWVPESVAAYIQDHKLYTRSKQD